MVRIAQLGISHDHAEGKARVMQNSDLVEYCGVFEPSEWIRGIMGTKPVYKGIHWFGTAEEILEDDTIDAVAVEGRVSENLSFARVALEHDKHVWLDKPAGDDLEEFRTLLDMARNRELFVQVGYMFRYNAGFQFLFEWAQSGKLGDLFSVRARICSGPSEEQEWERWDSRGEREGGMMFILACHVIDAVVTLLGRPNRVTTFMQTENNDFPGFRDNMTAIFEYPRALATVESTALEVSSGACRRIEVYGTRGTIIIEPLEPPVVRLCLDEDRDGYSKDWQTVQVENWPRYVESLRAFVADVRGEKKPDRTLDHEFAVQETVLRAAGLHED